MQKQKIWIDEYHQGVRYGLEGEILLKEKTPFQEIIIFESSRYGKGLLLDGSWMTAEKQEKYYHESLVHPALSSASNIDRILIIGGGDGGTAKECLKYQDVKSVELVEIDRRVIEISKDYLAMIGGNAWKDNRLKVHIDDGIEFVKQSKEDLYDVILIDGSDPIGPAAGLFNYEFIKDCRRILKEGGVFGMQSESPESFKEIHIEIIQLLKNLYDHADTLYGWVPMYPSGIWSWTFASMKKPIYLKPLKIRIREILSQCEIWSPRWQKGAFEAIPAFIEREIRQ